jgi:hypothetical protein
LAGEPYFQNKIAPAHFDTNNKTDMAEHPEVFHHVGLLFNEPPGTAGLLSI